jgi:hypothetical protein
VLNSEDVELVRVPQIIVLNEGIDKEPIKVEKEAI